MRPRDSGFPDDGTLKPVEFRADVVNDKQMARTCLILMMLCAGGGVVRSDDAGEDGAAFFREQIEPLLETHCLGCHSHDAGEMENGLTLDSRSGWAEGGDSGPAVVPGNPEESLLIQAIRPGNSDLQMPPDDPLDEAEVRLLEEWVRRGAPDPRQAIARPQPKTDWWSLKALVRPDVPHPTDGKPAGHPVDAFVNRKLEESGAVPLPEADRRTLIRRLCFVLHGLPPTPEQLQQFLNDREDGAYERLVDRLLESPRYGERWARHWLDVIHFADSHGCEHDVKRPHAWRFRDYVIERFNQDIPWARFVREQLAADAFFPDEPQLTAALGFIGAGPLELSRARTAPVTFDYLDRDDMVAQTMSSFVSTTANCARCHAHKFDPVTQEDYYALQAVFAGTGKGDVNYDEDPETHRARQHWTRLLEAARSGNADVLASAEVADHVSVWEQQHAGRDVEWQLLKPEVYLSAEGSTLQRQEDDSLFATGTRPEKDTYSVTATLPVGRLSGLRLDVMPDERLPMQGPGRQDNGNLHLSELEVRLFAGDSPEPKQLSIDFADADWSQDGWTIQHAIDSDLQTAWGIHPRQGTLHQAVFQFEESVTVSPGDRIVVMLKQQHGTGHLLGRFRLFVTESVDDETGIILPSVAQILGMPVDERTPSDQIELAAWVIRRLAESQLEALPAQATGYGASAHGRRADRKDQPQPPRPVHLLRRGNIEKPVREVAPGTLSGVPGLNARFDLSPSAPESERRAALADWIASRDNPLTWRSIVNRVWAYHFGRGICETPNDLGHMGSHPSHPDLLNWLAVWFRDDADGSLKQLHRLIVTSEAWKRRSAPAGEPSGRVSAQSADDRLLWRMSRRRLDAESVRDSVLKITSRLDLTMGGPGVEHFTRSKGQQLTPQLDYAAFDWNSDAARRRSIYRVVWRGIPDPFMEALDFPDLGLLNGSRGFSVSALQSLALYNNEFILHGSGWLAARLREESSDPGDQVRRAVELVWLRAPTDGEFAALESYAESSGLESLGRVLFNTNEFLFVD